MAESDHFSREDDDGVSLPQTGRKRMKCQNAVVLPEGMPAAQCGYCVFFADGRPTPRRSEAVRSVDACRRSGLACMSLS